VTEVVYVPVARTTPLAASAAFRDALNTVAAEHGQDVTFVIVPPRPTAGDLIGGRTPPDSI
jgi:hypothetical protein